MTVFGQQGGNLGARWTTEIKNVVVGKVLSMVRHPNSDHMVDLPGGRGRRRPRADRHRRTERARGRSGARRTARNSWLPGGVHITKGKLRGEVSGGMLCSFAELGLTQNDLPDAVRRRHSGFSTTRTGTVGAGLSTVRHRQRRHRVWILRSPTTAPTV